MRRSAPHATVLANITLTAMTLLLSGCKPNPAATKPETVDSGTRTAATTTPAGPPIDPATTGSVTGTIAFKGKAPERRHIDMSQDPVCSLTESKSPGGNLAEQFVVQDGHLANVYVTIKTGPAAAMSAAPRATAPVVLDQKGCRYVPHVIAIARGGSVEFRNSDPTMHNIHTMPVVAGNETIDVSQGPGGAPQIRRFPQPEVMLPVRCNNHPWMNAFINVAPTPFFAVSDTAGRFTIEGLPAGNYTLTAVHEKLGSQDFNFEVKPREIAKVGLTFPAAK